MQKYFFSIALICSSMLVSAQKDSTFFEIGMNVVPVIKNIQNTESKFVTSPYLLTLEKSFGKVGLRVGAGYDSDSRTELADPSNGNTNFDNDTSSMDLRFGIVLYKNFNEKWSLKYGVDALISNQSRSSNTFFIDQTGNENETLTSLDSKGFGISPFLFAQYHVSKNFSLGTEIGFKYIGYTSVEKDENSEFPEFNTETNRESTVLSIVPPTSLFLIVRF